MIAAAVVMVVVVVAATAAVQMRALSTVTLADEVVAQLGQLYQ